MKYQVGDRIILNTYQTTSGRQRKVNEWEKINATILIDKIRGNNTYDLTVNGFDDDFWWDDTMINHEQTIKLTNKKEINMKAERPNFEMSKQMLKNLGISKVVFNKPVVVVYLNDGRKGVAKCEQKDTFDEEVGFALAYTIAATSDKVVNKSNYKRHIDNLSYRKAKKKKDCVVVEIK